MVSYHYQAAMSENLVQKLVAEFKICAENGRLGLFLHPLSLSGPVE
jgi:hypothetical protein